MIGILTALAEAMCKNCGGKITQYRSDLELGARWYHEANGKETCPEAPTAWPVEDTVVDLTSRPCCEPIIEGKHTLNCPNLNGGHPDDCGCDKCCFGMEPYVRDGVER